MRVQRGEELRHEHDALAARWCRVEGQVRGIPRLPEEGAPRTAVAQHLAADTPALEQARTRLLSANVRRCPSRELAGDPKARRALDWTTERVKTFV